MKKLSIIALFALLAASAANAQFLKKLEKALTKANDIANSIAGQGSTKGTGKTGYITFQEEPSFVNSWGTMRFIKAVGNSETGEIQIMIQIKTKSGKNYSVKADKAFGPDGGQLVEGKNWTRGDWRLADPANGIYVSPVWVVPTSYASLSHVCVVTFLSDIWADIHNIPIEWARPAAGATQAAQPRISGKGFNGITTGMPLGRVPRTMAGVYSRVVESGMGGDGTQYECYDGDNRTVSFEDSNDDNIIDGIFVAKQGVQIENTPIYIGMPMSQFKIIKGIKRIPGSYNYSYSCYEISFNENNCVDGIYVRK